MRLDLRTAAVALVLAGLAGGSWWLTRTVAPVEAPPDAQARHDPDYILENFQATVMNERGRREYTLSAARMVHYGDDGSAELERPYLVQYGDTPVHTRAERGWMPKGAGEILLQGDVRSARGADPRHGAAEIRTERMHVVLDR